MCRMRVAVTGAQGVGKTTLAEALFAACREELTDDCELLAGIGMEVAQPGIPLGARASVETLCAFAARHLSRERNVSGALTIQDRCLLDLLGYADAAGFKDHPLFHLLSEAALSSLGKGVLILYLPIASQLRISKSDYEDSRFRKRMDEALRRSAERLSLSLETIEGSRIQRLDMSMRLVRKECTGCRIGLPPEN